MENTEFNKNMENIEFNKKYFLTANVFDIKKWLNSIAKIDSIVKQQDRQFIIESSKKLIEVLNNADSILINNDNFINIIKELEGSDTNVQDFIAFQKNSAWHILNDIAYVRFIYDDEPISYDDIHFRIWMQFYIKYKSNVLFNDWFFYGLHYYVSEDFVKSLKNGKSIFIDFNKEMIIKKVKKTPMPIYENYIDCVDIEKDKYEVISNYDRLVSKNINKNTVFVFSLNELN